MFFALQDNSFLGGFIGSCERKPSNIWNKHELTRKIDQVKRTDQVLALKHDASL